MFIFNLLKNELVSQAAVVPLLPSHEKQRSADLCDFKASLFYRANSRPAKVIYTKKPHLKGKKADTMPDGTPGSVPRTYMVERELL